MAARSGAPLTPTPAPSGLGPPSAPAAPGATAPRAGGDASSSAGRQEVHNQLVLGSAISVREEGDGSHISFFDIGSRVQISGVKSGVLRFFGRTQFQDGLWCGIELDSDDGNHGGEVQGVRYFRCADARGIFAPVHKVSLLLQQQSEEEESSPKAAIKRQNTFTIDDGDSDGDEVKKSKNLNMDRKAQSAAKLSKMPQPQRRSYLPPQKPPAASTPANPGAARAKPAKDKVQARNQVQKLPRGTSATASNYNADVDEEEGKVMSERDESLGILSPTDLKAGSLCVSGISDFGFGDKSDEPMPTLEEDSNSSATRVLIKSDVSSSTPIEGRTVAPLPARMSVSPIKTFSLDSNKLREIEALTKGDDEVLLVREIPVVQKTRARPKSMIATNDLVSKTESLLNSSKRTSRKSLDQSSVVKKLMDFKARSENPEAIRNGEGLIENQRVDLDASLEAGSESSTYFSANSTFCLQKDTNDDDADNVQLNGSVSLDGTLTGHIVNEIDFGENAKYAKNDPRHNKLKSAPFCKTTEDGKADSMPSSTHTSVNETLSLDTGVGSSMPSSMISNGIGSSMPCSMTSMATSAADLHSDLESSGVFSEADPLPNGPSGPSGGARPLLQAKPNVSPIEEYTEDRGDLEAVDEKRCSENKRKRPEYSAERIRPESKRSRSRSRERANESKATSTVGPSSAAAPAPATRATPASGTRISTLPGSVARDLATSAIPTLSAAISTVSPAAPPAPPVPSLAARCPAAPGLATRRSELLLKERIVPKTDVPSRLKAMLAEASNAENLRPKKEKKPGKWDGIMSQIAEGQRQHNPVVGSHAAAGQAKKVVADFKRPPVPLSKNKSESLKDLVSSTAASAANPGGQARRSATPTATLSRASSRSSLHSAADSKIPVRSDSSGNVLGDISNHTDDRRGMKAGAKDLRGSASCNVSLKSQKATVTASSTVAGLTNDSQRRNQTNARTAKKKLNKDATKPNDAVHGRASFHHQPDLVKGVVDQCDSSEEKAREIQILKGQVLYNAQAFDALAASFNHVANVETPFLKNEIARLQEEIANIKAVYAVDLNKFSGETLKYKSDTDAVVQESNRKISTLQEKHLASLEQARAAHRSELDELNQVRIQDLTQQDERHEMEVTSIQRTSRQEIEAAAVGWRQKLADALEQKRAEIADLQAAWDHKEQRLQEAKRALEEQVRGMEAEAQEQAEMARAKNAGDLQLQSAHRKLEKSTAEVDSLKVVLEMRSEEIRALRRENAKLEEKLEEFDNTRLELKKANAIVEDLKAQINTKNNLERRLSAENRKLSSTVEREVSEKKRLSMEKEELLWKIHRQSTEPLCLSMIEECNDSRENPKTPEVIQTAATPLSTQAASPRKALTPGSWKSSRSRSQSPGSSNTRTNC